MKEKIKKECKNCYGKGYSTEMIGGHKSFDDFDSEEYKSGADIVIHFCSCDRGKSLRRIFEIERLKIKKEILNELSQKRNITKAEEKKFYKKVFKTKNV